MDFFVAEANVAEAAAYMTDLGRKRGLSAEVCAEALLTLLLIVQVVENSVLGSAKEEALARIRDKDDWPPWRWRCHWNAPSGPPTRWSVTWRAEPIA